MGLALAILAAGGPDGTEARVRVVTTVYPLFEFTREAAGDRAVVVAVVPPGVEPHDWEPSPRELIQTQQAGLFVYNGAGLEPWVDRILGELRRRGTVVVRAADHVPVIDAPVHRDEARAGGLPRAGPDAPDPHLWLDPVRAQVVVQAIQAGLTRVDPAGAAAFARNAEAYRAKLAALDAAYATGLAQCARRDVVTPHAAFTYLARRYGLTQIAISGLSPEAEPSPGGLAALVRLARDRGVRHVFVEPLVSPKLAQTLAREIGAGTLTLDPIESLTADAQRAGQTYLTVMEANLRTLRTGLACR